MSPELIEQLAGAMEAITIFGVLTAIGLLLGICMRRISRRPPNALRITPIPGVLGSTAGLVVFLFVAQGVLLGTAWLPLVEDWAADIRIAAAVVAVILVTVGIAQAAKIVLVWSAEHRKPDGKPYLDGAMLPLLRLAVIVIVYVAGALVLLDQMNVSITPLIAGLGIGGLAVALALQPTLANFFAGTQIASDRLVKAGDYIELDGGTRGYVVEVGWRSTRIRTPYNNLVAIPNSRLAESVVTNFYGPTMDVGVIVSGGVSFSSDLEEVERVALQAANEVIHECPEAVSVFDPWFAFDSIADSNVGFWVWIFATDRLSSFRLTSELIKRLFLRFREAGIQVNYPMRKVVPWEIDTLVSPPPAARSPAAQDGSEAVS